MDDLPRLADALPTLTRELRASLVREGEPELAAQLDELLVRATCDCGEAECRSVYLAPWPSGAGGEYRVVLPDAVVTVGVRDGRIESIEDYALGADEPSPARAAEFAALEGRVEQSTPVRDRETIRALVGALPVREFGAGLDHRVYAVGDALVARFGEDAAAEAGLLRAIAPRLPLFVPVPTAVDAQAGCLIQPLVAGTSLLGAPRGVRRAFAAQLLAFAAALHALDPPPDVREDDTEPEAWREEAHATWNAVRDEVPVANRPAVEAALAAHAPARTRTPALIHGDLGAEHVFVDDGRITGVIDWGDAALGDPAVDHGRLLRDFGAPVEERARLYAIYTALEDLAYGLGTGDDRYRANALAALAELTCAFGVR